MQLTASAVKKMKVVDLRSQLAKRGLDTKGLKPALVDRLTAALDEEKQEAQMATHLKNEPLLSTEEASSDDATPVESNGIEKKQQSLEELSVKQEPVGRDEENQQSMEVDATSDKQIEEKPSEALIKKEATEGMEDDSAPETVGITSDSVKENIAAKVENMEEKDALELAENIKIKQEEEEPASISQTKEMDITQTEKSLDMTEEQTGRKEKEPDEEQAKLDGEQQAKQEGEEQVKLDGEQQAKQEGEEQVKLDGEQQAKQEGEEQVKLDGEQQAKHEGEEQVKLDGEQQAKQEGEEQAKLDVKEQDEQQVEEHVEKVKEHVKEEDDGHVKQTIEQPMEEHVNKEVEEEAKELVEENAEEPSSKRAKMMDSFMEVEEEKDETDDSSVVLSRYISDLFVKISPDGLTASVLKDDGFSFIWAGTKMTWGARKGKVGFECKVIKNEENDLPDSEVPKNGVRIGWSAPQTGLQLGEEGLSYGFENTAKSCSSNEFSEYGASYTQGDVIGCYLDLDSEEASISYTKNGEDLGVAFTFSKVDVPVLYPHVLVKNTVCKINCGAQEEAWFPCKEGYTWIEQMDKCDLVEGPRGPKEKKDCEVLMMVGLPASGKTTWVNKHVEEEKEKNYNIIGTTSVMAKMRVNGEERKRSSENYDKLMENATRCLRRIFEIAPIKKRNYILDQTNVHPNAQKRKMESFSDFKRVAIVVCPKPEELEKRTKDKKDKKGFEVPDFALNDMKANFTLPSVGLLFNEVKYIEENEEESQKIVVKYRKLARSSHNRYNNRRRDDYHHKGSGGRYHPYRRDNDFSPRGGSHHRDRHPGGRGDSNYGRQHGGSHDRRNSGHKYSNYGHNKGGGSGGYYKNGGGNRHSGNRNSGGYQKNYSPYQMQQSQQRYASAYSQSPQYSYAQPPVYSPYANPYQQTRPAYSAGAGYQQPQQAYYYQQQASAQGYYQQPYGQQPSYGQYQARRY